MMRANREVPCGCGACGRTFVRDLQNRRRMWADGCPVRAEQERAKHAADSLARYHAKQGAGRQPVPCRCGCGALVIPYRGRFYVDQIHQLDHRNRIRKDRSHLNKESQMPKSKRWCMGCGGQPWRRPEDGQPCACGEKHEPLPPLRIEEFMGRRHEGVIW